MDVQYNNYGQAVIVEMTIGMPLLDGSQHLPVSEFGAKASNMNRLATSKYLVPRGFALSVRTVSSIAADRAPNSVLAMLRERFEQLLDASLSKKMIVRSSSCLEDVAGHQYFGLFKSIADIACFESLVDAIRRAHTAAKSKVIAEYSRKLSTSLPHDHLALIVQEHISCDYSAVVIVTNGGCRIEAFRGQLSEPISGEAAPTVVRLTIGPPLEATVQTNAQQLTDEVIKEISEEIGDVTTRLRKLLQMPFMLEVGLRSCELLIFQFRELQDSKRLPLGELVRLPQDSRFTFLPLQSEIGLKAAAMMFFREKKLFNLPLHISSPFLHHEVTERSFVGTEWSNGPFTIRFSHKSDLGLPRLFVGTTDEILPAIRHSMRPKWTVIVHKYIEIARSFELLLFDDGMLLEHVPGMWESDNKLPPDILEVRGCLRRAWLWQGNRRATFARAGRAERVDSSPVSEGLAVQWFHRLTPIVDDLVSVAGDDMPLNIHFVEGTSGEWHFLNVRHGYSIGEPPQVVRPVHLVETIEDIKTWDGKSSILLRVSTNRGRENDLLPLIDALPRRKPDIFIECGVLSHPAMVLRENGIKVIPSYMAYPRLEGLEGYKDMSMNIDIGADPIERILNETPIFHDASFRVVLDREPIVAKHLLVVSNQFVPSFADLPDLSVIASALGHRTLAQFYKNEPWLFIERGRARFCTSGFTDSHAHGHVLPLGSFTAGTVEDLVEATNAVEFPSLAMALTVARTTSSEYVVFYVKGGAAFLSTSGPIDTGKKQFLRSFLTRRVKR